MQSQLTQHQLITKKFKNVVINGHEVDFLINLYYDDGCQNGYNTFYITCEEYKKGSSWNPNRQLSAGPMHSTIKKYFPQFAHLIKWHLCSSVGPMRYIVDALFYAKDVGCVDSTRACAIWPDAQLGDFTEENLKARLPNLMLEFKATMEGLGFTF
jgi:hypothetical protein